MENEIVHSFHDLFTSFTWKPIFGCSGRYILKEKKEYTLNELTGGNSQIRTYITDKAPDTVCVIYLKDGGIISYKKKDGTYIHTLNNKSGFKKKMGMLNIEYENSEGGE